MNNQDDKETELRLREQELREREIAIRLRELEAEVHSKQPLHQTAASSQRLQSKKFFTIGKFVVFFAAAILAIKVAAWIGGLIIVGSLAWVAYKLFFDTAK